MLSIFGKKENPKLYLGAIVVAPRGDLSRMDEWGVVKGKGLDDTARKCLEDLFSLPRIPDTPVNDNDLALEVIVPNIQGGEFTNFQSSPIDFPVFWRPKVHIKARLFYINSRKTKYVFDVSEKMRWSEYFGRVFSLRGIIRYKPLFESKELEPLLYSACRRLLEKMAQKK